MRYAALGLALMLSPLMRAGEWSAPGEVLHELAKCVTYRAKVSGEWLIVEAKHESPWHTYSMDNKVRVEEKLAGKKALSFDRPTDVRLLEGLELTGTWLHTPPKETSKPELRMYSWSYGGTSYLAAKVKRTGDTGKINVRGQVCTETNCKTVDVTLAIPAGSDGAPGVDLKALAPVR